MRLLKIGTVGTRTGEADAMVDFFTRVLGLRFLHGGQDLSAFELPDGSKAEVFGPSQNQHLVTGPLVEFLTDDLSTATEELRTAGVPIVSGPESWNEGAEAWVHFRAPDGYVYGITQRRGRVP